MGMRGARIYFENGIPSINTLRNQFKRQTGEYLFIRTDKELKGAMSSKQSYYLDTYHFDSIDVLTEGNTMEVVFGIAQYYFPFSFLKVLFDLGGVSVDHENKPVDSWTAPKNYQKLKPWKEYKWYNRPKK